ncbi:hypothetical protein PU629_13225 [Pullulanibacillus sp. KACC 23026]|uniref:hypothetical protein n=1 Tax=Pullulanibacillus sp. KACC 23026 TaxID=3028315 RepID=UPI0023AF5269|nr:hypothetical protein [Pullulanibacillus sp. KACC 23026]WEG11131.1 hypothetical protein PU629_13225 [Pullulanibacillus sp. KACC 23026]
MTDYRKMLLILFSFASLAFVSGFILFLYCVFTGHFETQYTICDVAMGLGVGSGFLFIFGSMIGSIYLGNTKE